MAELDGRAHLAALDQIAAYRRGDLFEKRRTLMANHCGGGV
jgi:hypothetical protein